MVQKSLTKDVNRCLSDESTLMYAFLRSSAIQTLIDDPQGRTTRQFKMLFSLVVLLIKSRRGVRIRHGETDRDAWTAGGCRRKRLAA